MSEIFDLDAALDAYRGRGREALLPALWDLQGGLGSISPENVQRLSHILRVPEADIYGVIGFYTLFHEKATGRRIVRVCADPTCALAGADEVLHGVCARLGIAEGETSANGEYTVEHSPCLGLCDYAPAALVSARGEPDLSLPRVTAEALLGDWDGDYFTPAGNADSVMLDASLADAPQTLAQYGDYAALRKALSRMTPDEAIAEVEASGLIGRGGAAFPTGLKWKFTRAAPGAVKYVVCNADESEPGTFKDRVLMEGDPFAVVEAIMIAAFATGSERAYVYVRGEYPDATERMRSAIAELESAGLLERACPIEIRRGAGAYICGEETALFNSIEGFRGEPRNKPPYPTESGLFGRPTLVNNVETLANILRILQQGGAAFAAVGTERSSGPKLFCLSGHVATPGVYEVPFGATVRELIELAGGVSGTGRLQAVLVGGAAGAFLGPDELDAPFTFEGMRAVGATVGSAVVMPFDDSVDLGAVLLRIAEFFRDESCGQCVPCRVGTVRQEELLERLRSGQPIGTLDHERRLLREVSQVMRDASICGLGHTAASAVDSALERFPIFQEATR